MTLDRLIFSVINTRLRDEPFNIFFRYITLPENYNWPLIIGSALLLFFGRRKGLAVILLAGSAIALDGLIGSLLLKNLIMRLRPCHALLGVNELLGCSRTFSFPSGHAAMWFSIAFVMVKFYRWYAVPMLFLAALVSYSRIYAGVHYPSDVAVGALLGTAIALALYFVARKTLRFLRVENEGESAGLRFEA